jgi:hypothetical protein
MYEPTNFSIDPTDYNINMDTRYLRDTYGEYFNETTTRNKKHYIETPLPEGKHRDYRYIASISDGVHPSFATQNLAQVSGYEIWKKNFNGKDLEEISKTVTLIKFAVERDDYKTEEAIKFDRNITLTDGSYINVEYVPYLPENTDAILADMNQHIAE